MIRKTHLLCAAASVVLLFGIGTVSARADTFVYTFTPATGGSHGFSFETSSDPTIVAESSTDFLALVAGRADGVGLEHSLAAFFTSGGLDFSGDCAFGSPACSYDFVKGVGLGPVLFTGSTSSPTLRTGSFNEVFHFTQTMHGVSGSPVGEEGVLTVTDVTPEPSSLILLGTGLLGFMGLAVARLEGLGSRQR